MMRHFWSTARDLLHLRICRLAHSKNLKYCMLLHIIDCPLPRKPDVELIDPAGDVSALVPLLLPPTTAQDPDNVEATTEDI